MAKRFETSDGQRTHVLYVDENEVWLGHHRGTGQSEAGGAFPAAAFLAGESQGTVRRLFGEAVLHEAVLAAGGGPDDVVEVQC